MLHLLTALALALPAQSTQVCVTTNGLTCLGDVANPLVTTGGGGGGGGAITAPIGPQVMATSVAVTMATNQTPIVITNTSPLTENLTQVGGSAVALGQTTMSASFPVTIASNQSSLPTLAATHSFTGNLGTITTTGQQDFLNNNTGDTASVCVTVTSASTSGSGTITINLAVLDGFSNPIGSGSSSLTISTPSTLLGFLCIPTRYTSYRLSWTVTGSPTFTTAQARFDLTSAFPYAADPVVLAERVEGGSGTGTSINTAGTRPFPMAVADPNGHLQYMVADIAARPEIVGGVATGASATGLNPVYVSGLDTGGNSRALSVSTSGVLNTSNTSADTTGSCTLNALNAACTIAATGQDGVAFVASTGTFVGILLPEVSEDGGTTWEPSEFVSYDLSGVTGSYYRTSQLYSNLVGPTNPELHFSVTLPMGVSNARVRVALYTSGSALAVIRASAANPQIAFSVGPTPDGAAATGNPVTVAGVDNLGNVQQISTDTSGNVNVNIAGSSGTSNVNLTQVGGAAVALGQTTTSGSIPVTMASNQPNTPADVTASGALALAGDTVTVNAAGLSSVSFYATTSTLIGTVVPEYTIDGTNWITGYMFDPENIASAPATANLVRLATNPVTGQRYALTMIGGAGSYRIRCSARSAGSATVTLRASAQISTLPTISYVAGPVSHLSGAGIDPYGAVVAGGVFNSQAGPVRTLVTDSIGSLFVVGPVATGSTYSTNPVITGGVSGPSGGTTVRNFTTEPNGNQSVIEADPLPPESGISNGTSFACTAIVTGGAASQTLASFFSSGGAQYQRVTRVLVSVAGTAVAAGIHLGRITAASGGTTITTAQHYPAGDTNVAVYRQSPTSITTTGGDYSVVFANVGDHELLQSQGHHGNLVVNSASAGYGYAVTTDGATTGASFTVCMQWDQTVN